MLNEMAPSYWRALASAVFHCGLFLGPHYVALYLRFQGSIPGWYQQVFIEFAPWVIISTLLVFTAIRIFRRREARPGVWSHSGPDLIVGSVVSGVLVYAIIYGWLGIEDFPRSVPLAGTVLLLFVLAGLRFVPPLARPIADRLRGVPSKAPDFSSTVSPSISRRVPHVYELVVFLGAGMGLAVNLVTAEAIELPYNRENPIVYDNDEVVDVYTDDYVMALASAGEIDLRGMITLSSDPKKREDRAMGVRFARAAGFRNIPDPIWSPKGLARPPSDRVEDTRPLGSEAARLIVSEANRAQAEKPVVIIVGGPLTAVADAYLLDPSIAKKIVVAWLGGTTTDMADYNGWADSWAAYIVLQRLRLVQFPAWATGKFAAPVVPKARLYELPESELRQWMIDKQMATNPLPDDRDADAPPAIALMRDDYVQEVKRVSFSHWVTRNNREQPAFKEDENGTALVVTKASRRVATEEWWRAMNNPAAWAAAN